VNQIHVRPEGPKEVEAVSRLVQSAFAPSPVHELLYALRTSSAWRDLSFVAELEGELVGHLAFTRGWLDAPARLVEVLILSPMSVLPRVQRLGIGTALVTQSLRLLADRQEPLVFLEGNPRFYSRAGFQSALKAGFVAPSTRIPGPAFQFFPLERYESWMTGQLVYPDVFWESDAVGLRPNASVQPSV
jgi:putative acetyltransferase